MSHTGPETDENRASSSKKTGFRATLANLWKSLREAVSGLWTRFISLFSKKPEPQQAETPSETPPSKPAKGVEQTSKTKDSMKPAELQIAPIPERPAEPVMPHTSAQQTLDVAKLKELGETLQKLWDTNRDFLKKRDEIKTSYIDINLVDMQRVIKAVSDKDFFNNHPADIIQTLTIKIEQNIKTVQQALEEQNLSLNSAPPATLILPTAPTASEVTQREASIAWAAIQQMKDSIKAAEPQVPPQTTAAITSAQQTLDREIQTLTTKTEQNIKIVQQALEKQNLSLNQAPPATVEATPPPDAAPPSGSAVDVLEQPPAAQPAPNSAATDRAMKIQSWEEKLKGLPIKEEVLTPMIQALDRLATEKNTSLENCLSEAEYHLKNGDFSFLGDQIRNIQTELARTKRKPS